MNFVIIQKPWWKLLHSKTAIIKMNNDKISNQENYESDKEKIYERLEYIHAPEGYNKKLPWLVQAQIAATNGKQYADRIGKLNDYPKYELPVSKVANGLMLDIGCGWGRWLVAASEKGYLPIGIDLRVEFCESSLRTMKDQHVKGYVVAADLMDLPFRDNVFDLIWSFSVIQHTHKIRLMRCLNEIFRILKNGGFTKLEFPNKDGYRNSRGPVKLSESRKDEFKSWAVRYYSVDEYRKIFNSVFGNFKFSVHSFLGIGVLKEDIFYVGWKNKILCLISRMLTRVSGISRKMKGKADSIYVKATKNPGLKNEECISEFMDAHRVNPDNNLNIIYLLRCPNSMEPLKMIDSDEEFIYNQSETYRYPVMNKIPVIIKSEAERIRK